MKERRDVRMEGCRKEECMKRRGAGKEGCKEGRGAGKNFILCHH